MKVVIMAGGMGTRIQSVRSDVPKPMIPVCGKPILQHQLERLKDYGLTDITIGVGHLGDTIKSHFGDGSDFGVDISYFTEERPLGTAGALFKMLDGRACSEIHTTTVLDEDFLLLCGDIIFDIDFDRLIAFHRSHSSWGTLVAHPNDHPYDSSLLVTEVLPPEGQGGMPRDTHRVVQWLAKEDGRGQHRNLVNAGIQLISPRLLRATLDSFASSGEVVPDRLDLDREVLKPGIGSGRIFAYVTPEYVKDMGTPQRYHEVERDMETGRIRARNLGHRQKAIFFDRDGTLNKLAGFISSPEQLELLPDVAEAIRQINRSEYLAIVVTNQPVIARGDCTFEELALVHAKLESELGKAGAFVDGLYFCPHHTDGGFPGERPEYKCNCDCRKPKAGLLLQAARDFNIDLSSSFMIGDSHSDVAAGLAAGCRASLMVTEEVGLVELCRRILTGAVL